MVRKLLLLIFGRPITLEQSLCHSHGSFLIAANRRLVQSTTADVDDNQLLQGVTQKQKGRNICSAFNYVHNLRRGSRPMHRPPTP